MTGLVFNPATPLRSYSGNRCARATTMAERLASRPPLVKLADEASTSNPSARAKYLSVARSTSLAAGECDHVASCGLYAATRASATMDAVDTLGLKRPKYRGCVT